MATFGRASGFLVPVYDQFGNIISWRYEEVQELNNDYILPGRQIALPPPGLAGAYHPNFPAGPPIVPAARSRPDMFFPPGLDGRCQFYSSAQEVPTEVVCAAPVLNEFRPHFPFPPNNFSCPVACPRPRTSSPPSSRTKEAEQWVVQRSTKGEEYYFNTKTSAWQVETPDCVKKYTSR